MKAHMDGIRELPDETQWQEAENSDRIPQRDGDAPYQALVVDDGTYILEVVAEMLRAFGYRVTKAVSGSQVLGRQPQKRYDLVITDLDMPGINGYDLARRLKPEAPEMKVIIMTGHCQAEVSGYMETGLADGWLFKPFSAKDLGAILKKFGLPYAWRQAPPR